MVCLKGYNKNIINFGCGLFRWSTYEGFEPGRDGKPGEVNNNFNFPKGLYDLRRDPDERYDLIEFYPGIVERLEEIAMEAREDIGDDLRDMPWKNRREPGLLVD